MKASDYGEHRFLDDIVFDAYLHARGINLRDAPYTLEHLVGEPLRLQIFHPVAIVASGRGIYPVVYYDVIYRSMTSKEVHSILVEGTSTNMEVYYQDRSMGESD